MAFAIVVLCLIAMAVIKLHDNAKWAKVDREAEKKNKEIYKPKHSYMYIEPEMIRRERDYVGEFEFANKMYQDLRREFREAHPVGSFYEYKNDDGKDVILDVQDENDWRKAFDLEWRFGHYDRSNAMDFSLWQARKDAVRRGFAPDNVKDTVWQGWDASKTATSVDIGAHGKILHDDRYDTKFYLMPETTYEYGKKIKTGRTTSGHEWLAIIIGFDPDTEAYQNSYNAIKSYLQRRQDYENQKIKEGE